MTDHKEKIDTLRAELAASEDRFAKVFDASPSLIVISMVETGQYYAVNDAWLKTMGYSRRDVIGKNARQIGIWLNLKHRERYISAFKALGRLRNYEVQLKTRSGDIRTFLASCDAILFDGESRLLTVFHDITDRKKSEEILRRTNEDLERQVAERTQALQAQVEATQKAKAELEDSEVRLMEVNRMLNLVLDSIPLRVFWKDKNLNILGCNRLFAMDAGFKNPRQVLGKSDYDMVWRDQADLYRADDLHVIKSKKPKLGYEEPQTNARGENIWLRTSKIPLRNLEGDVIGVLGVFEDITDRRNAEKALENAKQEAERANQAKSQFLSSMSHELRTPLNAILGFAQLMEYDPAHPLTDTQKSNVEHIKTGGNHLLNLINEILELAKIEAGHLVFNIESTNPEDVFYEAVPMAQSLAEKRDLQFHIPALSRTWPCIAVDAMRLKQVLLNLLSNAVKYNVDEGELTLDCEERPGCLRIIVSDTGTGISPDHLKELFQPFARLGQENSDIEGSGIGLTITKELVERMGGEIGVESELSKGTTFWVQFPIYAEHKQGMSHDIKIEPHKLTDVTHTGTVLYVEDNAANLKLIEGVFQQFPNLRLITAPSAEDGLKIAEAEQPGMIMLDITLPGMSGTEMLKTMRTKECCNVPIIALSAHAMPDYVKEGLEAGFDAYLTKPLDIELLVHELERVFNGGVPKG